MDRMQLLFLLACRKQRATYSAVAGYLGVEPRALMADLPRRPAHSWVVNAKTGMPTGYRVPDLDPALLDSDRVIASSAELSEWVQTHQPQRNPMSNVTISGNTIIIGTLTISLQRTLRLPQDGKRYPLPPSLGVFPIHKVDDFADKVPAAWREHGGVFFPMWQREAMWMRFGNFDDPMALRIAAGKVCAVTGEPWVDGLSHAPQNFVVCPGQPWLDGFKTAAGEVSQFVAMPLGMGYTVEKQITGKEDVGGIQLAGYTLTPAAKKAWEDEQREKTRSANLTRSRVTKSGVIGQSLGGVFGAQACAGAPAAESVDMNGAEMGLAAGGKMHQEIYRDTFAAGSWQTTAHGRVFIHIVNSQMYKAITGRDAPPSPISAQDYTKRGWPWFDLWDKEDVAVQPALAGVKTVAQIDAEKGIEKQQDDTSIDVKPEQVTTYGEKNGIRDGKW